MKKLMQNGVAIGALIAVMASASAAQDITFRYNDADVDVIEAAIGEFEAANPDIDVEIERIAWSDARTQFLREAAVGTGPDVVHIAFVWPLEMGQAGALMPLGDMIEANALQGGFDDFIATDLARNGEGTIYAAPWTTDTFTLIYNTEVLAEAGVEAPTTWEELAAASRAVTESTGDIGFGFPAGSSAANSIWFLLNYYMWSNGEAFVVDDGAGGYSLGTDAATLANAIEYFHDFLGEGGNPEANVAISSWSDPSVIEAMVSGEQAIAFMPPGTFREVVASYQERNGTEETPFVSGTIPMGSEGGISHLGGRSLGINANTEHPEAAYRLVQFLTGQSFFENHLTAQLPAQESLLDSIDFGPGYDGFAAQLPNGRSWGAYANPLTPIGSMWSETGRELGAVFVGEKTADEAAEALLSTIGDMLAE